MNFNNDALQDEQSLLLNEALELRIKIRQLEADFKEVAEALASLRQQEVG